MSTLTADPTTAEVPEVRTLQAPDAAFAARYRAGRDAEQALAAMQDTSAAALYAAVSERLRSL